MQLKGTSSTAIIVGGTAGIGFATARLLLEQGLGSLTIVGRNVERGENAEELLISQFPDRDIHFSRCDCMDAAGTETIVDTAADRMNGVDIMVSCGGGDPMPKLLHEIPITELMQTINMIVAGIIHPVRAVLPHMTDRKGGSIICLASDAAKIATPGESVIGAAMAAIVMFCRGAANEVKRHKIRINCLTPSVVEGTPLYGKLMADQFSNKIFSKAEQRAELGVVLPEDLAAMIAFLTSPLAAKITGQTISINGGISSI